jgi:peptidoglycan/LPS O-acetylase OafA/YrhL
MSTRRSPASDEGAADRAASARDRESDRELTGWRWSARKRMRRARQRRLAQNVCCKVQSDRGQLETLTALRFIAALLVFGMHAEQILELGVAPLGIGFVGVSFFFVLSGFVLTWSHRHGEGVGAFYWHRFARVWPLATLTTLLLIALGSPHGSVLLDLALLHGWGTGRMIGVAANPPSWSLGTEAFF